jgi:hypothetical protein
VPERATVVGAFADGWRRVWHAPWVVVGVLAALYLFSLTRPPEPTHLEFIVQQADRMLGEDAERTAGMAGVFSADTGGLGWVFIHELFAFGGVSAHVAGFAEEVFTGLRPAPWLMGLTAASLLPWILWTFFSGGMLDRLARDRPLRSQAFFGSCGVFFFRFLRLGLLLGLAYWALFRWIYPLLLGDALRALTGATAANPAVVRTSLEAIFVAALVLISVAADMAKVRIVIEDRRSAIGSIAAAARFVRRRWWPTLGVYVLQGLVFVGAAAVWLWIASSGEGRFEPVLFAAFVALRTASKLAVMASLTSLFQASLAHAGYTAAPEPVWPDSPAAEAMTNLRAGSR